MNKKTKLYLLIIVNLFTWGYVGYRVYKAIEGIDDPQPNQENLPLKKIVSVEKRDSVILLLNYPDPFLKSGNFYSDDDKGSQLNNEYLSRNSTPGRSMLNRAKTSSPEPKLEIKYIGLVATSNKANQTAILMVNGKSISVKVNDLVEDFSIKKISSEYVIAQQGLNKLVIRR